jgi:hypothetical protein
MPTAREGEEEEGREVGALCLSLPAVGSPGLKKVELPLDQVVHSLSGGVCPGHLRLKQLFPPQRILQFANEHLHSGVFGTCEIYGSLQHVCFAGGFVLDQTHQVYYLMLKIFWAVGLVKC